MGALTDEELEEMRADYSKRVDNARMNGDKKEEANARGMLRRVNGLLQLKGDTKSTNPAGVSPMRVG